MRPTIENLISTAETYQKYKSSMRSTFAIVRMSPTVLPSPHHDSDGHENVAQKVNLRSYNVCRSYSNSFTLSNASELF